MKFASRFKSVLEVGSKTVVHVNPGRKMWLGLF